MVKRLKGIESFPSLIALSGTVIAALISGGFASDILFNPAVYVEIKNYGSATPKMLITNDGSEAADNLYLYIQASSKIISVTNTFSTANVSLVRPTSQILGMFQPITVNNNIVEILITKLTPGFASLSIRNVLLLLVKEHYVPPA
jgi:hypothetical protein